MAFRMISASALPSAFRRAFEFGLRLIAVTDPMPSLVYAFTIFETVALLTPYDFAIYICFRIIVKCIFMPDK